MEKLKCAIGFLTILPISSNVKTKEEFTGTMAFFPIVALILGSIYYIVTMIANNIFKLSFFSAVIYIIISIIFTGGLHYDGLADSFDGLFSGKDKEKMLYIMQDSRIGAFGVLGIIINILLKLGIVYVFVQENILFFTIYSVIFSRFMQVIYSYLGIYAKEDGMGNLFIGKISKNVIGINLIFLLIIYIILSILTKDFVSSFLFSLISFILSFIILIFIKKSIDKKLGGITGDILGMVAEISETIYLFIFAIVIKYIMFFFK